jgi:hypothetical protein
LGLGALVVLALPGVRIDLNEKERNNKIDHAHDDCIVTGRVIVVVEQRLPIVMGTDRYTMSSGH